MPAALNNGVQPEETGWSNRYFKDATALLPAFDLAQREDWVSIAWDAPQAVDTVVAFFRLDTGRTFPAAVSVEVWDGRDFVPAAVGHHVGDRSEQPTTITFDKVSTAKIRLVMTSAAPGTPEGFVQISELQTLAISRREPREASRAPPHPRRPDIPPPTTEGAAPAARHRAAWRAPSQSSSWASCATPREAAKAYCVTTAAVSDAPE